MGSHPEWPPVRMLLSHTDRGGLSQGTLPVEDRRQEGEDSDDTPEITLDGMVADVLQRSTLGEYWRTSERAKSVMPDVVERFLSETFFTSVDDDTLKLQPGIAAVFVTQRIAREVAIGKPPRKFWKYGNKVRDIISDLQNLERTIQNPEDTSKLKKAIELAKGLAGSEAADLDMKVAQTGKRSVFPKLVREIVARYSISEAAITRTQIGTGKNGQPTYATEFSFENPEQRDITISIYEGPTKATPRRNNIYVRFYHTSDQKFLRPFLRIDIGEFAQTAADATAENRVGRTTLKQDRIRLRIVAEGKRLRFKQKLSNRKIMQEPDRVRKEADTSPDFMQIVFRALRQNLIHDDFLKPYYDLDHFMPLFTSASNFYIRQEVRKLVFRQSEMYGGKLWEQMLPKIMQEAALCFMVDPYTTVQFLRDTGISKLIPGLCHITRQQWDRLIRSSSMEAGSSIGIRGQWASEDMRTNAFMNLQRGTYRNGHMTNGLNMFINALRNLQLVRGDEHPWVTFVRLWEKDPEANAHDEPHRKEESKLSIVIYQRTGSTGATMRVVGTGEANTDDLRELARAILADTDENNGLLSQSEKHRSKNKREITDIARQSIVYRDRIQRYKQVLQRRAKGQGSAEDAELIRESDNWLHSLALVYTLLHDFPSGLTAKELGEMYSAPKPDEKRQDRFSNLPFSRQILDDALLDLKLLGLIYKDDQTRVTEQGRETKVVFYSYIPVGSNVRRITELLVRPQEVKTFHRFVMQQLTSAGNNQKMETVIREGVDAIRALGIHSVEALLSMTAFDVRILEERHQDKPDSIALLRIILDE